MRIALATVGTTGDIRPFAILARELADRGHSVTALRGLVDPGLAEPALAVAADPALRGAARALAARVGAEDGVGATVALLERAAA